MTVRLVNEIVDADDLEAAGHRWADRIAAQAPLAIRLTKSLFHAPRDAHPLIDDIAQAVLFETDDKHDRMTAFLERRKKD
jgi:enoyl-CoA hydratase